MTPQKVFKLTSLPNFSGQLILVKTDPIRSPYKMKDILFSIFALINSLSG